MPVIINEFEVVAPPPQRQQIGQEQPAETHTQPVTPPRPFEVELILSRLVQRRLRLWAD